ncbi:MAG: hypothetical protein WCO83_02445 [Alphaproteobacteria bacterium]
MSKTYYIATTRAGLLVSRASKNATFTVAAVGKNFRDRMECSFSTEPGRALKATRHLTGVELVRLRVVTAAEYAAARKAAGEAQVTAG